MRSIIFAAAIAALSSSAMAADVIYNEPVAPAPLAPQVYDWNGFYAGLNAGYGFGGDADYFGTASGVAANNDIDGFLGGVQVGYNWQSGPWVIGAEADIQYSDVSGSVDGFFAPGVAGSLSSELDYFGTVRGRVGYAFDNVLPYVTGGFAYGRNEVTADSVAGTFSDRQNHTGWTVGGGVEYGVTEAVSVKLEYLYTDLRGKTYFGDFVDPVSTDVDFHTVRAGLNFRF